MRAVDIIQKKKKGYRLSYEEIKFMIEGYLDGTVADYQMSAFLMAIYFQNMVQEEIADLTTVFVESGDTVDLSSIDGIKVDKHSTGGVGDKISLIVIPLVASTGIPVAKMSGRGLGHTGGTIDKLESIDGFSSDLDPIEFIDNVNKYKMAIAGQTSNLVPADKKIYALRDVTATVDSLPLIASSVMSKKIAAGADAIVLDVKVGSGAFMKSLDDAIELAEIMVTIGKSLNRKTVAVITNMNQPLGREVGNANEVREAMEVLKGYGEEDETVVALTIASYMCILGGKFNDFATAYKHLESLIHNGVAFNKFKELIRIQGGDSSILEDLNKFPQAKYHIEIKSNKEGYVSQINAEDIGLTAMIIGAGRKTKDDKIDHAAGLTMNKKIGDIVSIGSTLCTLHTNFDNVDEAIKKAEYAYKITNESVEKEKFIYKIIE